MMKTILLTLSILFAYTAGASGLNSNASYIKEKFPTEYKNTIRKHAMNKWGDDFTMVVYEINKQADALVELIDGFKPDNTSIAYKAIKKWSIEGYESKNMEVFDSINTFGLKELLRMNCDWTMVKYEYDKQAEAKSAF